MNSESIFAPALHLILTHAISYRMPKAKPGSLYAKREL